MQASERQEKKKGLDLCLPTHPVPEAGPARHSPPLRVAGHCLEASPLPEEGRRRRRDQAHGGDSAPDSPRRFPEHARLTLVCWDTETLPLYPEVRGKPALSRSPALRPRTTLACLTYVVIDRQVGVSRVEESISLQEATSSCQWLWALGQVRVAESGTPHNSGKGGGAPTSWAPAPPAHKPDPAASQEAGIPP